MEKLGPDNSWTHTSWSEYAEHSLTHDDVPQQPDQPAILAPAA